LVAYFKLEAEDMRRAEGKVRYEPNATVEEQPTMTPQQPKKGTR